MSNSQTSTIDLNPIDENLDKLPKLFYKYRMFDPKGYGIQLASNGTVYFPSATRLNDPFETRFIPNSQLLELDGDKLIAFLITVSKRQFPYATKEKIDELVELGLEQKKRFENNDPKAMQACMETQNKFGIFSMSTDPFSIPMWSYYGKNHTGMCIGLRTDLLGIHQRSLVKKNKLLVLHEVNYSNDLPKVCVDMRPDGFTDQELKELELTLYTKSNSWAHENEYRLVFHNYANKTYTFGSEIVAEIILGVDVSDSNIDLLLKNLNKAKSKAKVKQLDIPDSHYSFKLKEI